MVVSKRFSFKKLGNFFKIQHGVNKISEEEVHIFLEGNTFRNRGGILESVADLS